jgi:hypothetical protein
MTRQLVEKEDDSQFFCYMNYISKLQQQLASKQNDSLNLLVIFA